MDKTIKFIPHKANIKIIINVSGPNNQQNKSYCNKKMLLLFRYNCRTIPSRSLFKDKYQGN